MFKLSETKQKEKQKEEKEEKEIIGLDISESDTSDYEDDYDHDKKVKKMFKKNRNFNISGRLGSFNITTKSEGKCTYQTKFVPAKSVVLSEVCTGEEVSSLRLDCPVIPQFWMQLQIPNEVILYMADNMRNKMMESGQQSFEECKNSFQTLNVDKNNKRKRGNNNSQNCNLKKTKLN